MRIKSLDGWRAISIALVVLGHLVNYRYGPAEPHLAGLAQYLATLGVSVFFVISGYLITSLSLESEARQPFSAGSFYLRRAFRILPAYAVFVSVIATLSVLDLIHQPMAGVAKAAVFACNLPGLDCGWFANHSWSLAYEQQFYLLFPLLFIIGRRARGYWVAGVYLVATSAAVLAIVGTAQNPPLMFVGRFAPIIAGVLTALHAPLLERLTQTRWVVFTALAAVGASFVLSGLNVFHVPFANRFALDTVLVPPAFAVLILRSTSASGWAVSLLNLRSVAYVGSISYSLYLWQQLFTGAPIQYAAEYMLNPVLMVPAAMLSYHLVEQPFTRLGRKMMPGGKTLPSYS
jgi:peptidoglycan/LPS O-acetylase OafA/YrhL